MTTARFVQSDFMHWAKFKPPARFALTASEVPHFRMDSMEIHIADLDLDGASHPRYAPLREAIARKHGVTADQVVAADGTSMANFLAMATLVQPGDEVLIEQPTYEPLVRAASFLGAHIKRFDRRADDGFRIDVERVASAATPRTRLIVITNLHNPSSALVDEKDLRALAGLAKQTGAHILVDEVYLDSAVPPRRSAVHLGPEFVCTSSLTKVYGLSGLRCGWILAEPDLAERMWRLNDLFGVNQAHASERLACIAFEQLDAVVGDTPALLEAHRRYFNAFVASRPDVECMPAEHGIIAFPRWLGGDTDRLDELLRERFDTAIVPGRWFDLPEHFRIGFGCATGVLEEGLKRLGAALDELR